MNTAILVNSSFTPQKPCKLSVQSDLPAGYELAYALEFTGNAFLREALSKPAWQVAQYVG